MQSVSHFLFEDAAVATLRLIIELRVPSQSARPMPRVCVAVEECFAHSSNVGMSKLAYKAFADNPSEFKKYLHRFHLDVRSPIDLSNIPSPQFASFEKKNGGLMNMITMSFGYAIQVSPLHTLTLYNAIANNGRMMKPYLVNSVRELGVEVKSFKPQVLVDKICSDETLSELKTCLEGVCVRGTARSVFKNTFYTVAGKTGTALVANGNRGYADHIYQSSFAGYFPANHPRYTCIVVIKNKPFAKKFLGASVAGPVFKEVSDKLMSIETNQDKVMMTAINEAIRKKDSTQYYYSGNVKDIKHVMQTLNIEYKDSTGKSDWGRMYPSNYQAVLNEKLVDKKLVPDVKGMGLKDALAILEERNIKVAAKGIGKVRQQSIQPGTALTKNETLTLELN